MKSLAFLFALSFPALLPKDVVQWTNIEQAGKQSLASEKPIFMLIGTDWCKYCNYMKLTTLENDAVIDLLNRKTIAVDFNAEKPVEFSFKGRQWYFDKTQKTHELALALGKGDNGKLIYPTLLILNTQNEITFFHQGAMNSEELIAVLKAL